MPEVGDVVKPFETQTANGKKFLFPQDLLTTFTILVVYRKNACVPCRVQLEYLREAYSLLLAQGVHIIAISYPPQEESARVAIELQLPYPILSDPEGKVLKLLEVINEDKLKLGGAIHSGLIFPTIFIVDRQGKILFKLVTKKTATRQEFAQVYPMIEKFKKIS